MVRMSLAKVLAVSVALGALSSADARDMKPDDVAKLPASMPTVTEPYGTDDLEYGELRVPPGKGPFPVAIVVHGGCWTKGFATLRGTAPIASALTDKGIATWNVEYRQLGDAGGGWPGTFRDWADATDHLRGLAARYPLDLKRVIVVGHSAGAHAALWIASRSRLSDKSEIRGEKPLRVRAAVAIDGPGDLAPFVGFDAQVCGKPVIAPLLGGTPAEVPTHYAEASPKAHLPLGVPQVLVSSAVLTPEAAAEYVTAAKGDPITIVKPAGGDHFNIIAPGEPQWADVEAAILKVVPAQ